MDEGPGTKGYYNIFTTSTCRLFLYVQVSVYCIIFVRKFNFSCIQVLNRVLRTLSTPKYSVSRFSILSRDCCSEHRLRVSRDNFRSTVVNHTKRRQNTPYNYILISWGRCELSRIVSRLFVTRRTTKGQSAVLKLGSERAFLRCHESTTQSRDNVRTSLTNYIHLPHTITP